jgi:hypothetical protein
MLLMFIYANCTTNTATRACRRRVEERTEERGERREERGERREERGERETHREPVARDKERDCAQCGLLRKSRG